MKKNLLISSLIVTLANVGHAALLNVNESIPDGNPVGVTTCQTIQDVSGMINSVSVTLNISGGFNGDLYGALVFQDSHGGHATQILLNRIGVTGSDPIGSLDSGFNVTLSDSGTASGSIHGATGVPTGTWLPDSQRTFYNTFGGMTPNGTWTLHLADLCSSGDVGGDVSVLNSWALDITTITAVPEPATGWVYAPLLLFTLAGMARRSKGN